MQALQQQAQRGIVDPQFDNMFSAPLRGSGVHPAQFDPLDAEAYRDDLPFDSKSHARGKA